MAELAGRRTLVAAAPRIDGRMAAAIGLVWSAGLIHASAAIAHLDEYVPFAVFFEALAAAQVVLGVALYRSPSDRLLRIGALVSVAVVALWAVSRTVGLPLGPHPWTAEPVGALDAVCSADELALVALVYWRRLGVVAGLGLMLLSLLLLVGGGHAH